jgi:hypothetical protein
MQHFLQRQIFHASSSRSLDDSLSAWKLGKAIAIPLKFLFSFKT